MTIKIKFEKFCKRKNIPFSNSPMALRYGIDGLTDEQIRKLKRIQFWLQLGIKAYLKYSFYRKISDFILINKFNFLATSNQLINECIDAHYNPEKNRKYLIMFT